MEEGVFFSEILAFMSFNCLISSPPIELPTETLEASLLEASTSVPSSVCPYFVRNLNEKYFTIFVLI